MLAKKLKGTSGLVGSGGSAVDLQLNLVSSSAPTGFTLQYAGNSPAYAMSSTYGFQTAGNALGFAYPGQGTDALDENKDWLIQASVLVTNNCSDPAIGVWRESAGRTAPTWGWGTTNSTVYSTQLNCHSYQMLNTPIGGSNSSSLGSNYGSGVYYTLHLWYFSGSGTGVKAHCTIGQDDWAFTGTKLGGTNARYRGVNWTGDVYWGLGSDYDGVSVGSSSTNFNAVRVREHVSGVPAWPS